MRLTGSVAALSSTRVIKNPRRQLEYLRVIHVRNVPQRGEPEPQRYRTIVDVARHTG